MAGKALEVSTRLTLPKKHIFIAWLFGGIIYMYFAIAVVADAGFMAIPFQIIMGAVFSIILVGVAFVFGFLLRIPVIFRIWYSSWLPQIIIILIAIGVILFGEKFGMGTTFKSPENGMTYHTLHPIAGFISWFVAVFSALHFSTGVQTKPQAE